MFGAVRLHLALRRLGLLVSSVQGFHPRPEPLIDATRARMYRGQHIRILVRRPKAIESDEFTIPAMHAADAVVFVPARAIGGRDQMRLGFALA